MSCNSLCRSLLCAVVWWPLLLHGAAAPEGLAAPTTVAQAQQLSPELEAVRADFEIALAVFDSGDMESALPLWRDIVVRAPQAVTPRANLALIELRLGHLEVAEQIMQELITQQPQAAYYNQLGVIQRQRGKFAAARASYEKALELDETLARAHLNLAILCELYLQELPTALQHYHRYQALSTEGEHRQLASWIGDLERRLQVTP